MVVVNILGIIISGLGLLVGYCIGLATRNELNIGIKYLNWLVPFPSIIVGVLLGIVVGFVSTPLVLSLVFVYGLLLGSKLSLHKQYWHGGISMVCFIITAIVVGFYQNL